MWCNCFQFLLNSGTLLSALINVNRFYWYRPCHGKFFSAQCRIIFLRKRFEWLRPPRPSFGQGLIFNLGSFSTSFPKPFQWIWWRVWYAPPAQPTFRKTVMSVKPLQTRWAVCCEVFKYRHWRYQDWLSAFSKINGIYFMRHKCAAQFHPSPFSVWNPCWYRSRYHGKNQPVWCWSFDRIEMSGPIHHSVQFAWCIAGVVSPVWFL